MGREGQGFVVVDGQIVCQSNQKVLRQHLSKQKCRSSILKLVIETIPTLFGYKKLVFPPHGPHVFLRTHQNSSLVGPAALARPLPPAMLIRLKAPQPSCRGCFILTWSLMLGAGPPPQLPT